MLLRTRFNFNWVTAQSSLMIEPVISYLLGNCSCSTETQYLAFDSDRCDLQTDSLTSVYMTRLKPRENLCKLEFIISSLQNCNLKPLCLGLNCVESLPCNRAQCFWESQVWWTPQERQTLLLQVSISMHRKGIG